MSDDLRRIRGVLVRGHGARADAILAMMREYLGENVAFLSDEDAEREGRYFAEWIETGEPTTGHPDRDRLPAPPAAGSSGP